MTFARTRPEGASRSRCSSMPEAVPYSGLRSGSEPARPPFLVGHRARSGIRISSWRLRQNFRNYSRLDTGIVKTFSSRRSWLRSTCSSAPLVDTSGVGSYLGHPENTESGAVAPTFRRTAARGRGHSRRVNHDGAILVGSAPCRVCPFGSCRTGIFVVVGLPRARRIGDGCTTAPEEVK